MKELKLAELIDLVVAGVPKAEGRIQKMFDWHFERDMMITKWFLGAAASLFVAVLVAFFRAETIPVWWQSMLVASGAVATSSYGIYRLRKMRTMHRSYVAALKALSRFRRISAFLLRYQEARK